MAQTQTDRFDVRMTSDSHFGWIRTRLSVERTMMSCIRTAVCLIGFGFTIVQFFQHLNATAGVAPALQPQAPRYLGLALIGAGVLTLLISGFQFWRLVRYLWREPFRELAGRDATGTMEPVVEQSPILATTLMMAFIGLFAFGAVLLRMT
jgi:putative membrane protein